MNSDHSDDLETIHWYDDYQNYILWQSQCFLTEDLEISLSWRPHYKRSIVRLTVFCFGRRYEASLNQSNGTVQRVKELALNETSRLVNSRNMLAPEQWLEYLNRNNSTPLLLESR